MAETRFTAIYDRFLGKITDDMYLELTPQDTLRDLQNLLIDALPNFEFPRCNLNDYTIDIELKNKKDVTDDDFVLGVIWHTVEGDADQDGTLDDIIMGNAEETVMVDKSVFNFELTSEEINIIAVLMMHAWVQRQVTSIENTRMKYSGTDFKMTSQANHLQKLISLLNEVQKQSVHVQRLYKRRRIISDTGTQFDGLYRSNWDVFGKGVYYDRYGN